MTRLFGANEKGCAHWIAAGILYELRDRMHTDAGNRAQHGHGYHITMALFTTASQARQRSTGA
jgi:hypothetical protein